MLPFEGARIPQVWYDASNLKLSEEKKKMSNITYEWPPQTLSNLMGAYDEGKWEVKVIDFATGAGTLKRGTVVCLDAAAKGVIAAPGVENQAFGILLDESLDTTVSAAVGNVARAGSFKANQLIVSTGTDAAKLTSALRQSGVFLEGDLAVPSA